MKRSLSIFIVFLFFCQIAWAVNSSSVKNIKQPACLTVAVYGGDLEPFVYWKNNKPQGFSIALARHLAKSLGLKACFVHTAKSFNDLVTQVKDGDADISISFLTRSVSRAKQVDFSQPYLYPEMWLVVSQSKFANMTNQKIIRAFKTNAKLKIAILKATYDKEFLKRYQLRARDITVSASYNKLNAVASGKVDAALINQYTARYWIAKNPALALDVRPIGLPNSSDEIAVALPYHSQRLANRINISLSRAKLTGLMQHLKQHYLDG